MKSIGFGLLCLLFTALTWAEELEELEEPQPLPDEAEPIPIFLPSYQTTDFALSAVAKMNWFQAEAACASQQGWTLVSLQTQVKQSRVFNFLIESGYLSILNEPLWTSGTNLANLNQWSWFSIGSAFRYRNFLVPPNTSQYRCLGFNPITGYWSADDCTAVRYFICEKRCDEDGS